MAQYLGRSIFELSAAAFLALFLLLPLAFLFANLQFFPLPLNLIARNFLQALLSASVALLLAFPLAYALTKRTPLTRLLSALSLVPLVLPQPAMILSLIILFGANGLLKLPFPLYGLEGIVLAHSLYNFPLAARIIASRWQSLENLEGISRILGADKLRAFAFVTIPSLLPSIFSAFLVAFAFSFTSFAIPLVFGGIINSTIEVEIFRTFFRDFNFSKGVFLALIQILVFLPIAYAWKTVPWGLSFEKRKTNPIANYLSYFYIMVFAAILLGPFLRAKFTAVQPEPVFNSLLLAFSSAILSVILWISMGAKLSKYAFLLFAVSPAILAVSYYFLPYSHLLLAIGHGLLSLALVNAILLPFRTSINTYMKAAALLGAGWHQRFRHVYLPLSAKPFLLAFLFSFSFSMGETAFLSSLSQGFETMSMKLLQAFSLYRFGEGYLYTIILISMAILISLIIEGSHVFQSAVAKKV